MKRYKFCKVLFAGVLLLFSLVNANAQFRTATIEVDGLTCSMCTNSVERLLRQLDFVEEVKMDLNATTCQITFMEGKKVEIYKLADKVIDAGFSVRMIKAVFNFNPMIAREGSRFSFEGDEYIFVKTSGNELMGEMNILFIGKKFLSKKELPAWSVVLKKYKETAKGKNRIYYITI